MISELHLLVYNTQFNSNSPRLHYRKCDKGNVLIYPKVYITDNKCCWRFLYKSKIHFPKYKDINQFIVHASACWNLKPIARRIIYIPRCENYQHVCWRDKNIKFSCKSRHTDCLLITTCREETAKSRKLMIEKNKRDLLIFWSSFILSVTTYVVFNRECSGVLWFVFQVCYKLFTDDCNGKDTKVYQRHYNHDENHIKCDMKCRYRRNNEAGRSIINCINQLKVFIFLRNSCLAILFLLKRIIKILRFFDS